MAKSEKRGHINAPQALEASIIVHKQTPLGSPFRDKRLTEDLKDLLGLVNLVKKGVILPKALLMSIEVEQALRGIPGEVVGMSAHSLPDARKLQTAIGQLPEGTELLKAFLLERLATITAKTNLDAAATLPIQLVIGLYQDIRHSIEGFREILQLRDVDYSFRHSFIGGPSVSHIDENHILKARLGYFETATYGLDIRSIRECPVCGSIFFQERIRSNQEGTGCSKECNKKLRHDRWARHYEERHGRPYRPKMREPKHVSRVREALEGWGPERFDPTEENLRILAAEADVTFKQCQSSYEIICENKAGPDSA